MVRIDQPVSVVWKIKDGKRGHENQSQGLVQALGRLAPIECVDVDVRTKGSTWLNYLSGSGTNFHGLSKPDLILGAGSRTHATLLAAGRATGAPTIVMMAPPRWIRSLFDLCIVPEHDGRSGSNIVTTKGVLNLIEPSKEKSSTKGLFLVGGASKHHDWNSRQVVEQMTRIIEHCPGIEWTATTSRRSPKETRAGLDSINIPNLTVVPVEQTDADWLPAQLAKANYVWVTEDSVSMVYEALSSGARVGVLAAPRKTGGSRVIRGVDRLIAEGQVLPFGNESCDLSTFEAPDALNEAARVARIVFDRFLRDG